MIAITRSPSAALQRCQLVHQERRPIDIPRALEQHEAYEQVLTGLGCTVVRVPPAPTLPDAVFVEDTAVVVDEVAVATRPGAPSRRPEVAAVADVLAGHRPLLRLASPATLDGGDVLRVERTVWVGLSRRTSREGAEQLRRHLAPFGYDVRAVPVDRSLHLKTAATALPDGSILVNPGWLDPGVFEGREIVEVDPGEPFAANVLTVGDSVVAQAGRPRTRSRLLDRGLRVTEVEMGELAKAEAGVTCCSVLLADRPSRAHVAPGTATETAPEEAR